MGVANVHSKMFGKDEAVVATAFLSGSGYLGPDWTLDSWTAMGPCRSKVGR